MPLRPYQQHAVDAAFNAWEDCRSTLIVLPTGTGKTVVATEIIRRFQPKKTLFLAHREELIFQARKRIWEHTGLDSQIEMGEYWAETGGFNPTSVIISTIQTQNSGKSSPRMNRFNPDEFGLVVVDEAHHIVAKTYKKVLEYYKQNPDLKILCLTATPDRADEEALGQLIDTVCFDYEILDAIKDGWLVPVDQQMVHIEGLDFSRVRVTAGDLNGADLAAVMEAEKNLQGIAASSIDIMGNKKSLVFTVTVRQAEMLAEIYNRYKPEMANWICGETPKDQRHNIVQDFAKGRLQVLVNVGCLTEGFDDPGVECIVQAKPTRSRSLYAQIIGRGLRPLPGIVDGVDDPIDRQENIAVSAKPAALILDFVGNAGRHKLMSSADILGGNVSEEVIEAAKEAAKKAGAPVQMDMLLADEEEKLRIRNEIEEARKREAARKAHLTAEAKYKTKFVDPFDLWHLEPQKARGWDRVKKVSLKQREVLLGNGFNPDVYTFTQASQIIGEIKRRRTEGLCTPKQSKTLARYGYDPTNITFEHAGSLIDNIANNGWQRPDL